MNDNCIITKYSYTDKDKDIKNKFLYSNKPTQETNQNTIYKYSVIQTKENSRTNNINLSDDQLKKLVETNFNNNINNNNNSNNNIDNNTNHLKLIYSQNKILERNVDICQETQSILQNFLRYNISSDNKLGKSISNNSDLKNLLLYVNEIKGSLLDNNKKSVEELIKPLFKELQNIKDNLNNSLKYSSKNYLHKQQNYEDVNSINNAIKSAYYSVSNASKNMYKIDKKNFNSKSKNNNKESINNVSTGVNSEDDLKQQINELSITIKKVEENIFDEIKKLNINNKDQNLLQELIYSKKNKAKNNMSIEDNNALYTYSESFDYSKFKLDLIDIEHDSKKIIDIYYNNKNYKKLNKKPNFIKNNEKFIYKYDLESNLESKNAKNLNKRIVNNNNSCISCNNSNYNINKSKNDSSYKYMHNKSENVFLNNMSRKVKEENKLKHNKLINNNEKQIILNKKSNKNIINKSKESSQIVEINDINKKTSLDISKNINKSINIKSSKSKSTKIDLINNNKNNIEKSVNLNYMSSKNKELNNSNINCDSNLLVKVNNQIKNIADKESYNKSNIFMSDNLNNADNLTQGQYGVSEFSYNNNNKKKEVDTKDLITKLVLSKILNYSKFNKQVISVDNISNNINKENYKTNKDIVSNNNNNKSNIFMKEIITSLILNKIKNTKLFNHKNSKLNIEESCIIKTDDKTTKKLDEIRNDLVNSNKGIADLINNLLFKMENNQDINKICNTQKINNELESFPEEKIKENEAIKFQDEFKKQIDKIKLEMSTFNNLNVEELVKKVTDKLRENLNINITVSNDNQKNVDNAYGSILDIKKYKFIQEQIINIELLADKDTFYKEDQIQCIDYNMSNKYVSEIPGIYNIDFNEYDVSSSCISNTFTAFNQFNYDCKKTINNNSNIINTALKSKFTIDDSKSEGQVNSQFLKYKLCDNYSMNSLSHIVNNSVRDNTISNITQSIDFDYPKPHIYSVNYKNNYIKNLNLKGNKIESISNSQNISLSENIDDNKEISINSDKTIDYNINNYKSQICNNPLNIVQLKKEGIYSSEEYPKFKENLKKFYDTNKNYRSSSLNSNNLLNITNNKILSSSSENNINIGFQFSSNSRIYNNDINCNNKGHDNLIVISNEEKLKPVEQNTLINKVTSYNGTLNFNNTHVSFNPNSNFFTNRYNPIVEEYSSKRTNLNCSNTKLSLDKNTKSSVENIKKLQLEINEKIRKLDNETISEIDNESKLVTPTINNTLDYDFKA